MIPAAAPPETAPQQTPERGRRGSSPRRRRGLARPGRLSITVWVLLGVLAVLILIPAGLVAVSAFSSDVPRPGATGLRFTWDNVGILAQPQTRDALLNSLVIGIAATALAGTIGALMAFLAARTDIPGRKFVYFVGLMPIFMPSYVGALAWSILGSPNAGLLNILQRDLGTGIPINVTSMAGLIFVFALYYSPYTFLLMHSAMSLLSPDLEEAARVHGANQRSMFRWVSLPLATPAMLGAGTLTFVLIFENYPVAQVLGGPGGVDTLPTMIYRLLNTSPSRGNESAVIALLLVLVVVAVTVAQNRYVRKRSYTTVTGKGFRQRRVELKRMKAPALIFVWVIFTLSIVLPVGALLIVAGQTSPFLGSITDLFRPGAFDLSSFGEVLGEARFRDAAYNSLVVSFAAAALGTVLAFAAAYVVYRTKARGKSLVEGISMVPLAIPAVVLGMGLLWTWLLLPVPLYGTLTVLVIAFLAVQSPQGFRGISASILSTDRDLEDAAVMLGASRVRAILRTTVPLMKIGLVSTFLLLLMLSMRELTVPLFLYTSNTEILSIAIYDAFENSGALRSAAAVSILYLVLMFVISIVPHRLSNTDRTGRKRSRRRS